MIWIKQINCLIIGLINYFVYFRSGCFWGVLGTRFGSLELKIALESKKIIIGSLEWEKIGSLQVHTRYLMFSLKKTALDHRFSTQNPSKSLKVSKESDFSLVFNKNFSEIPASRVVVPKLVWAVTQIKVAIMIYYPQYFAVMLIMKNNIMVLVLCYHWRITYYPQGHNLPQVGNHWSRGLGLGPDEVGQNGLKVLRLWCHSQKIQNP